MGPAEFWSSATAGANTRWCGNWPQSGAVSDIVCAPGNAGISRPGAMHSGRPRRSPRARRHRAARRDRFHDYRARAAAQPRRRRRVCRRGLPAVRAHPAGRAPGVEQSLRERVHAAATMCRRRATKRATTASQALTVLRSGEFAFPVVLKADGLAAGKGVVISPDLQDAESQVHAMMVDKRFGQAGARARDRRAARRPRSVVFRAQRWHARAARWDRRKITNARSTATPGPNTGGMGAYAPSSLFDAATQTRVMNEIVVPVLEGMRARAASSAASSLSA